VFSLFATKKRASFFVLGEGNRIQKGAKLKVQTGSIIT
jgi:hypothetical protein